jgi:hypothetical protein
MAVDHKQIVRSEQHAPRVDHQSLVLENGTTGEAQQARINAAAMTGDQVVLWDSGNDRLKTTGVTSTELGVLDGVVAGDPVASKALVVDSNRDLGDASVTTKRIRDLRLERNLYAATGYLTSLQVSENSVLQGDVQVSGDLSLNGEVVTNIVLNGGKITSKDGSTAYDVVVHDTANNFMIYGSTSRVSKFYSSNSYPIFRDGSVDKIMWHSGYQGSGTGLDADKLDAQHGSYYRDASNLNAGTVPVARIPNLDASKVTSGTLSSSRIPNLDADKVTSGTLSLSRIPNIDEGRIPNLDASKITTGKLNKEIIPPYWNSTVRTSGYTIGTFDFAISCRWSSDQTLYLPAAPDVGRAVMIFRATNSRVTVNGNGRSIRRLGSSATSYTIEGSDHGAFLMYDGTYWVAMWLIA